MNMDSDSVYELITALCEQISLAKSSQHVPGSVGSTSQPNSSRHVVKKLRALSYEILLHKSTTIPTYKREWKNPKDDGFEYIRDPVGELLLSAVPDYGKPSTPRMEKLQDSIDRLKKSEMLNDPNIVSVVTLLLDLSDQVPEKNDYYNPGFFNTGQFHVPTYAMDGSVTPYPTFSREMFQPTMLLKSLAGLLPRNNLVIPYEMPDRSILKERPDFNLQLTRLFSRTSTGSKLSLNTPRSSYASTAMLESKPSSSSLGNFSHLADLEYNILSLEDGNIWDWVDQIPSNHLRMWESIKDLDPKKFKLHLTEVSDTSLVHNLLHVNQILEQSSTAIPTTRKFCIISYSKYIGHLRYMLMGIQSTTFLFDEESNKFVLDGNTCLADISPEVLTATAADLMECGSYCRRLNSLTSKSDATNHGPIFRQLYASVQRYLYFYKAVIISISDKATILGISVKIKKQMDQMRCLANLLRLDSPLPLPTGGELLPYLYDEIITVNNCNIASIFISVLHSCVTSYLRYLERWLFEGCCDDAHKEFFIEPNPDMLAERSRLFWKSAFIYHKKAVPGFMQGLEKAVYETGKSLHLLKLCNPSDPLLKVLEAGKPKLKFPHKSSDLIQNQAEFESYYQRCTAVTGPPVTVDQWLERSHEQENALHKRVQEVYAARHVLQESRRKLRAEREVAAKNRRLQEWQLDCQRREEFKEKEKQRMREAEEKWLREECERDKELAYLEAERCIIEEHKAKMNILDQEKEYYEGQLAAYQPKANNAFSVSNSEEPAAKARLLDGSSTNEKPGPNNNELPTPNGNTQVDINTLLDNYPVDQKTTKNNWINIDSDVQNRNIEPNLISPVNNNVVEVIQTGQLASDTANSIANLGELKKPRTELTLDITRNLSASNIRKKVMGTDACLAQPWHPVEGRPSKSQLLTVVDQGISRKGSAERIKRKMWGLEDYSPQALNTSASEATSRPTPRTAEGLAALANRNKVLQSEYGLLTMPAESNPTSQYSRPRNKVLMTSEEIRCKVLKTEYDLPQLTVSNATETDIEKNRNKAMHGEFDLVTGDRKVPWLIQNSSTMSADQHPGSIDSKNSSPDTEQTVIEPSPSSTPIANKVEYSRNESLLSNTSAVLTPLDCQSVANTGSVISAESTSSANPFFNSIPLKRMNSYATCAMYDKGWEQYLKREPSDFFLKVLAPKVEAVDALDPNTTDMEAINNMLKKAIIVPLRTQMKLANDAIVKFFLINQDLVSHLQSLRNYYFLLDGEFGSTVTSELFRALSRSEEPDTLLKPFTLNKILAHAIDSSMNKDHRNVPLLSFTVKDPPTHFNRSAPQVLSCLNLDYKVKWPLNIIITDEVLQKYKQVFEFLLKLRRASWVLEEDFIRLKQLGKNKQFSQSGQYIRVTLMRQEMMVLITALHYYVTSAVLQASWSEFIHDFQHANTIEHIYHAHVLYIKTVHLRCLLGLHGRADNFHKYINNIFVLVLKFHEKLNLASWTLDTETKQYQHPHFIVLAKIVKCFQEQAGSLVQMSKKLATKKYYSHLIELMQKLSMNNYYEKHKSH